MKYNNKKWNIFKNPIFILMYQNKQNKIEIDSDIKVSDISNKQSVTK